jgi:hypothetical protein
MMHLQTAITDNPYDTHSGSSMACLTCELSNESSLESTARALINELDPANACDRYELSPEKDRRRMKYIPVPPESWNLDRDSDQPEV